MANLAGWPYWKVVSITGQSGAGTDYQAKLTMGDSAGGEFHLEGHCTNFPQDIRITDDDGTTLLDHFVEDLTADPIIVHVEVKDDLGSNRDIRVYYGKSGETTASDGAATFLYFDSFEDGDTTDAGDFFVTASNLASTDQAKSGSYSMKTTNNVYEHSIGINLALNSAAIHFSCYVVDKTVRTSTFSIFDTGGIAPTTDSGLYGTFGQTSGSTDRYSGGWLDLSLAINNGWNDVVIVQGGTTADIWVNGNKANDAANRNTISNIDHLYIGSEPSQTNYYDDIYVRKYNDPEPAFSSAGAEQTPTGVSPTGVFYGSLTGPFGGPI